MHRVRHFSWGIPVTAVLACLVITSTLAAASDQLKYEYRVLSGSDDDNAESTMERELEEAATHGFRCITMTDGGSSREVIMEKQRNLWEEGIFQYRLLETAEISTMKNELEAAAAQGFRFVAVADAGQSILMRKNRGLGREDHFLYRYLEARLSTLRKELKEASAAGFVLAGVDFSNTPLGGESQPGELVSVLLIMEKQKDGESECGRLNG